MENGLFRVLKKAFLHGEVESLDSMTYKDNFYSKSLKQTVPNPLTYTWVATKNHFAKSGRSDRNSVYCPTLH